MELHCTYYTIHFAILTITVYHSDIWMYVILMLWQYCF